MGQTKTIGSILLDVELVTQQDIDQALELQKQTGKRLGEVLVNLGVVSDDDIRWALAEQLNLPYVNIRKDQIDSEVATLLPEKIARRYHVIPILKIDDELTVVVDDPLNTTVIHDIEMITQSDVKISLGRTSDILLAIDEIYGSEEENFRAEHELPPRFVSSWFPEENLQKILNDPSGYALMEQILDTAFSHDVSRIYLQPGFDLCHVSYRVNGVLQEQMQLGKEWFSILLFRLKISAHFDMSESRQPQYREFLYEGPQKNQELSSEAGQITLAVSLLPTATGESAVLNAINKPLKDRWFQPSEEVSLASPEQQEQDLRQIQTLLRYVKSGAVLLGGAPQVDKITTLYGLLSDFDSVQKKIVTLESSSEYRIDKYYQVRYSGMSYGEQTYESSQGRTPDPLSEYEDVSPFDVREEAELTKTVRDIPSCSGPGILHPAQQRLSSWLLSLQAQDVDALLVDHIASDVVLAQCLDIAAHSLLLASLDFPDIFQLLAFLLDCQAKPSMLTSRVHALLAQQSIRLLCPECKQLDSSDFGKQLLERIASQQSEESPELFGPCGCPACNMTGYVKQIVIFESLHMDPWLKELVLAGTPLPEIQQSARERGFLSIEQKALDLLFSGQTSIEEVFSLLS